MKALQVDMAGRILDKRHLCQISFSRRQAVRCNYDIPRVAVAVEAVREVECRHDALDFVWQPRLLDLALRSLVLLLVLAHE